MQRADIVHGLQDIWIDAIHFLYQAGAIRLEGELESILAGSLTGGPQKPVYQQTTLLAPLGEQAAGKGAPDLVWAALRKERGSNGRLQADILAIIELKYDAYPKVFADVVKLARMQAVPTEPFACAGWDWNRTYTELFRTPETVYALGVVGRADADGCSERFPDHAHETLQKEGLALAAPIEVLQIVQPNGEGVEASAVSTCRVDPMPVGS